MSARAAVFGTIVWAAGFLVSAVALKGNPIGDWIEGALLAGVDRIRISGSPVDREPPQRWTSGTRMKLAPGNHVLPFSTVDVDGHPVSLEQFRGHPLLLMFFRYASCPMCNLRLHDFAKEYPRLHANGLSAVAFFHSSARAIRRNAGRRSYVFPLVADPNQEIYRAFGVKTSWTGFLKSMALPSFYWSWIRSIRHGFWGGADMQMAKMPANFLVGPDSRFLLVHYGKDIGDHLSLADTERALAELSGPGAAVPSG